MDDLKLKYKLDTGLGCETQLYNDDSELINVATDEYVEYLEEKYATLIRQIPEKLKNLEIPHLVADDCYYSCDLDEDKQDVHETTGICTCGADYHNELVEEITKALINI